MVCPYNSFLSKCGVVFLRSPQHAATSVLDVVLRSLLPPYPILYPTNTPPLLPPSLSHDDLQFGTVLISTLFTLSSWLPELIFFFFWSSTVCSLIHYNTILGQLVISFIDDAAHFHHSNANIIHCIPFDLLIFESIRHRLTVNQSTRTIVLPTAIIRTLLCFLFSALAPIQPRAVWPCHPVCRSCVGATAMPVLRRWNRFWTTSKQCFSFFLSFN